MTASRRRCGSWRSWTARAHRCPRGPGCATRNSTCGDSIRRRRSAGAGSPTSSGARARGRRRSAPPRSRDSADSPARSRCTRRASSWPRAAPAPRRSRRRRAAARSRPAWRRSLSGEPASLPLRRDLHEMPCRDSDLLAGRKQRLDGMGRRLVSDVRGRDPDDGRGVESWRHPTFPTSTPRRRR